MKVSPLNMNNATGRMRVLQRSSAATILTLSLLLTALARGDEPGAHHFDIAAQNLSSALNEYARQSQQQILFSPDIVAGKISSPLQADMQPLAALEVLLKDSGLTFTNTPNGTILVGNSPGPRVAGANTPGVVAPNPTAAGSPNKDIDTITVEGAREKEMVRRQIRKYVSGITRGSFGTSLARWEKRAPLCPLVAGLSKDDGEYILSRLSQITTAAGAPLAPEHCKPNFYVIVTSEPDELMKAWSKRDPWMFDSDVDEGGTVIRRFLNASIPVRAWYNIEFTNRDGWPGHWGLVHETDVFIAGGLRDLYSIIEVVDARLAKGVSFGQLAAYIAMVGLAQIRLDANLGDAPTVLQVFSNPDKAPPLGLSTWDQAYLKALYHTERPNNTQHLAIARSMVHEIAP
jgi:hypothetical protein